MCDYGRVMYQRVGGLSRLIRFTHRGNPVGREQMSELLRLATARAKETGGDGAIAFVTTGQETNEANWAFFDLARRHFPEARLFVADGNDPGAFSYHDDLLVSEDKNPNLKGAVLIGEHFGAAVGTGTLAAALASGEIKVLVVLGGDLLGRLGRDDFDVLVVVGTYESKTSKGAEYILPASAHLEQDGTFVNANGRVQRLRRAIPAMGDSVPAYRLLHELAAAWGNPTETQIASVVFKKIAEAIPAFRGMTYETLGDSGQDLVEATAPAPAPSAQPSI
jgi:NADH-quinone oxidoreductase subunit G